MKTLLCLFTIIASGQLLAFSTIGKIPQVSDKDQMSDIWSSLSKKRVFKHTYRDRFLTYAWANEIEKDTGITPAKIVIHFPSEFRFEYKYQSEFATALVIKVGSSIYVLDKIRASKPILYSTWKNIILKEASSQLEATRKKLVSELHKLKDSLLNHRRMGGWLWGKNKEEIENQIDTIYDEFERLGVNEYAKSRIHCRNLSNSTQIKESSAGRSRNTKFWCNQAIVTAKAFDLEDVASIMDGQKLEELDWDEEKLNRSQRFSFLY